MKYSGLAVLIWEFTLKKMITSLLGRITIVTKVIEHQLPKDKISELTSNTENIK